ncbi:MAG TPA: hypothetical protein VLH83_04290, partial [Chthoniobacterales bacterium]|nr:hypothetical protein [Chthoniobacterales bacterium]
MVASYLPSLTLARIAIESGAQLVRTGHYVKSSILRLFLCIVLFGCRRPAIAGSSQMMKTTTLMRLLAATVLLFSAAMLSAFDYTGSLITARFQHTATLLSNGKVLVAGGAETVNFESKKAELYDPMTGAWTATGSMNTARHDHRAILFSTGKVLVVGGDSPGISAELYDPATEKWTATGSLNAARHEFTATLLPSGKV